MFESLGGRKLQRLLEERRFFVVFFGGIPTAPIELHPDDALIEFARDSESRHLRHTRRSRDRNAAGGALVRGSRLGRTNSERLLVLQRDWLDAGSQPSLDRSFCELGRGNRTIGQFSGT